jgi:hypothetical protein
MIRRETHWTELCTKAKQVRSTVRPWILETIASILAVLSKGSCYVWWFVKLAGYFIAALVGLAAAELLK